MRCGFERVSFHGGGYARAIDVQTDPDALPPGRAGGVPMTDLEPAAARGGHAGLLQALRRDPLLLVLLLALVVLAVLAPTPLARYPSLVDWPTMAALTGLLALTQALELSGALQRLGLRLLERIASERSAALHLVLAAALLSTLLTNDVALFVVVPLTLGLCRVSALPATRLIVFEALAVNAGSALTPIGNPQNLFLWQGSGVSFAAFVWHMLPLVAALMILLLGLTGLAFGGQAMRARGDRSPAPLDRPLLGVSLLLYVPFLLACELHHAGWALAVVLGALLLLRPRALLQLDWGLLLVFLLMFVDLRLLAGLDAVRHAMLALDLGRAPRLYLAAIGASQLISNVPAAIALASYSADWRVLAYGVNVGGFGLAVGSLANLIALRMADERRAWWVFHAYAVPFLVVACVIGYGGLFGLAKP